jgi:glycosyltransferase involved in cell wall biosynthesis
MNLAYLINTYPSPSHSFVRREITALEAAGISVRRFALRSAGTPTSPEDRAEADKTQYILNSGAIALAVATLKTAISAPAKFAAALNLAFRLGRRSDVGVFKHLIYLAEACVLLRWLIVAGTQHIHAHFGTNSTTVAMLCQALGGPTFSFTAHGPEEFDKPQALNLTEKINRAAFVVAVCSFGRSQLFRWCARDQWDKIHIIHCGVDDLFLKSEPSPAPAAPNLLQVGRLSEQKGQLLLIDAARQLSERSLEFHLTLVGDGELRPEIESLIRRHDLGSRITLAGWKTATEIRDLMLASRALIMPSFAEGLPVVLMESLALGRPVVSTYIAGIPELVEPGISGWLVPAGDSTALADAMALVLSASSEQLDQLGSAGRDRVLQNHDASHEAAALAAIFRRTINQSQPHPLREPLPLPLAEITSAPNA